jgi:rhodanese-related sulfurtransferase
MQFLNEKHIDLKINYITMEFIELFFKKEKMRKLFLLFLLSLPIIYFYRHTIKESISNIMNHHKKTKSDIIIDQPSYYLINVLDAKEFQDAHIKGSINVPFSKINTFLNTIENKEIPLIFYCSNYYCTASDAAAKIAVKKNFKTVFVYKGGMAEWYQASKENNIFEYEGPAKEEYLQIVILPQEEVLDPELDIIDEDNTNTEGFKIISINNLQNFLKEGIIIK